MEQLTDLVLTLAASPWLYLVMFGFAAIDGFFPPVPSETVLVAVVAVALAGGEPNILAFAAAAAAGALLGDVTAHAVGRHIGLDRFRWMRARRGVAALTWARGALARRGALAIIVGRYIPVGRVAVNLTAGATGMPRRRFIPIAVVGAASWAGYCTLIGVVAGQWAHENPLLGAFIGVAIALVLGLCIDRSMVAFQKRTRRAEAPALATADAE
jgi:membrane-associated protein